MHDGPSTCPPARFLGTSEALQDTTNLTENVKSVYAFGEVAATAVTSAWKNVNKLWSTETPTHRDGVALLFPPHPGQRKGEGLSWLFEDLPKHHESASKPFEDIPKHHEDLSKPCEDIPKDYESVSRSYEDVPKYHRSVSKPYEDVAKHHEGHSKSYEDIPKDYESVLKPYADIPEDHEDLPKLYEDILKDHEDLSKPYEDIPENHESASKPYEDISEDHKGLLKNYEFFEEDYEDLLKHNEDVALQHEALVKPYEDARKHHEELQEYRDPEKRDSGVEMSFDTPMPKTIKFATPISRDASLDYFYASEPDGKKSGLLSRPSLHSLKTVTSRFNLRARTRPALPEMQTPTESTASSSIKSIKSKASRSKLKKIDKKVERLQRQLEKAQAERALIAVDDIKTSDDKTPTKKESVGAFSVGKKRKTEEAEFGQAGEEHATLPSALKKRKSGKSLLQTERTRSDLTRSSRAEAQAVPQEWRPAGLFAIDSPPPVPKVPAKYQRQVARVPPRKGRKQAVKEEWNGWDEEVF